METGYLRSNWGFGEALARGLTLKGQRSGSESPNRYGSAANKGKREEFVYDVTVATEACEHMVFAVDAFDNVARDHLRKME
jgi:hypothetical protein